MSEIRFYAVRKQDKSNIVRKYKNSVFITYSASFANSTKKLIPVVDIIDCVIKGKPLYTMDGYNRKRELFTRFFNFYKAESKEI